MTGHSRRLGLACCAAAMLIVGSSVTAGALLTRDWPVHLASALRFGVALGVLLPLLRLREGRWLPPLSGQGWRRLAMQSLLGAYGFTTLLLHGLERASPVAAGIITSTTPAWTACLAWLFLKEPIARRGWLGVALSLLGVVLVNLAGADLAGAGREGGDLRGGLMVLGAVLCESLFLLLRKRIAEPLSALGASAGISLCGLCWFLPQAIPEAQAMDWGRLDALAWGTVLYYGLVVTVLAYLFWFAGVTRVDAASAGVATGIMPVSAVVTAALVLGEAVSLAAALGCVLVLGGIACLALPEARSYRPTGQAARAGKRRMR